jgi:hypothetical protein
MLLHTRLHVSAKTSHLQDLRRTLKQNINYVGARITTLLHCVPLIECLMCDVKNFVKLMRIQFMLTVRVLGIDVSWLNQFSLQKFCKLTYSVPLVAEFTTNAALFLNQMKSLTCIIKFETFMFLFGYFKAYFCSKYLFFNRPIILKYI